MTRATRFILVYSIVTTLGVINCSVSAQRIVTLSAALTETVHDLGYGSHIVAVDVTSESPEYVRKLPKVSKNRNVSAEGVTVHRPTLVLAPQGDVPARIIQQWRKVGVNVHEIPQEYSVAGAKKFIQEVSKAIGTVDKGVKQAAEMERKTSAQLVRIKKMNKKKPKVLFIYARGAGTMNVAGKSSSMASIIELAGGRNAINEFSHFKPYNTEALVRSNPDVILMFDFGLSSIGGKPGLLRMPGVAMTNAGKDGKIFTVDGSLMINFSTRLPDAIHRLSQVIYN